MTFKTFLPLGAMAALLGVTAPAAALDIGVGLGGTVQIGGAGADLGVGIGVDIGAGAGAGAGAGTGGGNATGAAAGGALSTAAAVDFFANADVSARVQAVIDLMASNWDAGALASASAEGAVAYDVGAWLDARTRAQFDAAATASASAILALQAAIAANASLSAWLSVQDIDVASVVALGATADGTLVAFTD